MLADDEPNGSWRVATFHELSDIANLWGIFLLLLSLGLFLIGGTGIYLWFKTYEERVIGSVLLGVGLVYGITFMILTRQLG